MWVGVGGEGGVRKCVSVGGRRGEREGGREGGVRECVNVGERRGREEKRGGREGERER